MKDESTKKERESLENRKHEIDMARAKAPRANIGMAVFGIIIIFYAKHLLGE